MKVQGTITPIKDKILVAEMNFDNQRTKSGIIIPSDNGKVNGIHPRWGKVWAIGPEQVDVKVGEWVLVEHGRWTRGIQHETETGETVELRMVENSAILMVTDEEPSGPVVAGE
jgi:co-chaperonin GroES (HSP10)